MTKTELIDKLFFLTGEGDESMTNAQLIDAINKAEGEKAKA